MTRRLRRNNKLQTATSQPVLTPGSCPADGDGLPSHERPQSVQQGAGNVGSRRKNNGRRFRFCFFLPGLKSGARLLQNECLILHRCGSTQSPTAVPSSAD